MRPHPSEITLREIHRAAIGGRPKRAPGKRALLFRPGRTLPALGTNHHHRRVGRTGRVRLGGSLMEMPSGQQLHIDGRDLGQHRLDLLTSSQEGAHGIRHGDWYVPHPRAAPPRA